MNNNLPPSVSTGAALPGRPPSTGNSLTARLADRDATGRFLSVLTGDESDAELRELALRFMEACPVNCDQHHCPFRILGHLYHASSKALINTMSRSGLVSLFEGEVETRRCALRSPEG